MARQAAFAVDGIVDALVEFARDAMRKKGFAVLLAAIVATVLPCRDAHADVYLSEFLALNVASITDEDGDYSDWIEIYNTNAAPIDLGGWYLTDDASSLTKWRFPSTAVPAGGYLVVFASDKDRAVSGAELHTSFKLSGGGEYLGLVRSDGTTVEHEYAPAYPAQTADISWGLSSDLSQNRCFLDTTPGATNDDMPSCGIVDAVEFSVERGFFDAPFTVSLSTATPGALIYYTLDGQVPSVTDGVPYAGPIAVATSTTIRATAVAAGFRRRPR